MVDEGEVRSAENPIRSVTAVAEIAEETVSSWGGIREQRYAFSSAFRLILGYWSSCAEEGSETDGSQFLVPLERQCFAERAPLRSCAFASTKDRCDRSSYSGCRAEARCARRFTEDCCCRNVDREAVAADVIGS
jgi:hypothetical protein